MIATTRITQTLQVSGFHFWKTNLINLVGKYGPDQSNHPMITPTNNGAFSLRSLFCIWCSVSIRQQR
ncbi:hypothetical protein O6P43_001443 [Quillaja saponaria]|uniref:Uncharacterized protein n=1 Tax=Quillaja saponaria TaxID=32244 RepID=A0AAD7QIS6_QUISA|nr:hypothetical protein O6P43_001443 [Quillaja saponaria]